MRILIPPLIIGLILLASISYSQGTCPPIEIVINTPEDGYRSFETSVDISGTAYSLFGIEKVEIFVNGNKILADGTETWSKTITLEDSNLPENINTIKVMITDTSGLTAWSEISIYYTPLGWAKYTVPLPGLCNGPTFFTDSGYKVEVTKIDSFCASVDDPRFKTKIYSPDGTLYASITDSGTVDGKAQVSFGKGGTRDCCTWDMYYLQFWSGKGVYAGGTGGGSTTVNGYTLSLYEPVKQNLNIKRYTYNCYHSNIWSDYGIVSSWARSLSTHKKTTTTVSSSCYINLLSASPSDAFVIKGDREPPEVLKFGHDYHYNKEVVYAVWLGYWGQNNQYSTVHYDIDINESVETTSDACGGITPYTRSVAQSKLGNQRGCDCYESYWGRTIYLCDDYRPYPSEYFVEADLTTDNAVYVLVQDDSISRSRFYSDHESSRAKRDWNELHRYLSESSLVTVYMRANNGPWVSTNRIVDNYPLSNYGTYWGSVGTSYGSLILSQPSDIFYADAQELGLKKGAWNDVEVKAIDTTGKETRTTKQIYYTGKQYSIPSPPLPPPFDYSLETDTAVVSCPATSVKDCSPNLDCSINSSTLVCTVSQPTNFYGLPTGVDICGTQSCYDPNTYQYCANSATSDVKARTGALCGGKIDCEGGEDAKCALRCCNPSASLPAECPTSYTCDASGVPRCCDSSPPVTIINVDCEKSENGWCTTKAIVTITSTDDSSGVKEIKYRYSKGVVLTSDVPWITKTGSSVLFELSESGVYDVEFYAVDNTGKVESAKRHEWTSFTEEEPITTTIESSVIGETQEQQKTWFEGMMERLRSMK